MDEELLFNLHLASDEEVMNSYNQLIERNSNVVNLEFYMLTNRNSESEPILEPDSESESDDSEFEYLNSEREIDYEDSDLNVLDDDELLENYRNDLQEKMDSIALRQNIGIKADDYDLLMYGNMVWDKYYHEDLKYSAIANDIMRDWKAGLEV